MGGGKNTERTKRLKDDIINYYNWEKTAEETENIYS